MRATFIVPRLRGLVVTATTVLALIAGGAGLASAATTSASTSHAVASRATSAHPAQAAAFTIGPVRSFKTEEQCVQYGALEFPPGSTYLGYTVIGTFCEYGPGEPPLVGKWWNLYVHVENPPSSCKPAVAGAPAVEKRC